MTASTCSHSVCTGRHRLLAVAAVAAAFVAGPANADPASGTISLASRAGPVTVTVKHAYLVIGPDEVSGKPTRRLVLAAADVSSKIRSCAAMSCSDGDLREGMTIDLDSGARLNYWVVANDQRVQYSGAAKPASLKLTTDTSQRVAGTLAIDDSAAGGAKSAVQFDASLLKEFSKAR
jgi:hypothetical protein